MIYTKQNFIYLVKINGTRKNFSELTGISINTIKAILDKKCIPSLETLIILHDTFNLSLDDLVFKDLEAINRSDD